ncbi:hypothetical protein ABBQ32_012765 [Trebouxia sp. C0010 RCD-2024]
MFWRKNKSKPSTEQSSNAEPHSAEAAPSESEPAVTVPDLAVFEFGRRKTSGLVMQGVCTTSSEVPACVWFVGAAADHKSAQKDTPKYHIEF